jgi:hypothetical protein
LPQRSIARPESGLVSSPAALLEVVMLTEIAHEPVSYQQKYVRPAGHLKIGDRWMKRYQITDDPTPIEPVIQDAADAYVRHLMAPTDDWTPPAGFAVLHQDADRIWINCYSWVADNKVHCRSGEATATGKVKFSEVNRPWVGGVWELAPFAYERSCWVRHMRRDPDDADLGTYLADTMPEGWFD